MGSALGVAKAAATRVGLTLDEYQQKVAAGDRYCFRCKAWHPVTEFGSDASRADGLDRSCRSSKSSAARAAYVPVDGPRPLGRRYVDARDGDEMQARRRVNHLVDVGILPRPNDVPCVDCGHVGSEMRHEYDHYLGYAAEHHEDVEAVCVDCHHARTRSRAGQYDAPIEEQVA